MVISSHSAIVWIRSHDGEWVMKWSGARPLFPRLAYSTEVMARLAARGLPVAAPHPLAGGQVRVVVEAPGRELSVCILPEVAGEWLDVDDAEAVRVAGASLAELHLALSEEPLGELPAPVRSGLRERVVAWLANADHGHDPAASERLRDLLAATPESDQRGLQSTPQLLHGDWRAANILTRGSDVVAVLDFDDMEVGTRVDELARSAVYLRTRFRDWQPTSPTARQTFRAGYESVCPLSPTESRWFEIATLWYGLAAIPMHGRPDLWAAAL